LLHVIGIVLGNKTIKRIRKRKKTKIDKTFMSQIRKTRNRNPVCNKQPTIPSIQPNKSISETTKVQLRTIRPKLSIDLEPRHEFPTFKRT
jgi:hypothetical protein